MHVALFSLFAALAFAQTADAATIIHTNDVLGEIEPCGCRTNPLGGMARKWTFARRLADQEQIQLDAGDLLFPSMNVPPLLEKQSFLQAQYLLRTMELMKHDAIVPGEKDFALGWDSFQKLRKGTKIPFLAANLTLANGEKAFEPSMIFERKGSDGKTTRVAVIGLVGEELAWPKELRATSVQDAARAELKRLRSKADVFVALTHQGLEKDEELAAAVPDFDMIIGAHTQSFLQKPPKIGKTWIYQSSFRDQYVGAIELQKPFTGENYQLIGLDAGYDSPKDKPSEMDQLVTEFKKSIGDLNAAEAATLQPIAIDPKAPKFQTFPKCAECHIKQFEFWRKTPHAGALHALVTSQQSLNKECLSCHTVGLGDEKGFNNVTRLAEAHEKAMTTQELDTFLQAMKNAKSADTKVKLVPLDHPQPLRQALNGLNRSWSPVQCENCHLPGRDHPFGAPYSKVVETSRCLQCHTADRAPKWYSADSKLDEKVLKAKFASMKCPAGN